jgi:hypothetical protein
MVKYFDTLFLGVPVPRSIKLVYQFSFFVSILMTGLPAA